MNTMMKTAIAFAAVALAGAPASAKTVAWYHFNEGASGETAAGGQPVVLNAVDPTSLAGTPYVAKGKASVESTGNNLPVYTNDMPYGVSWYDPVTGARGGDNRSLFLKTGNRKGSYTASTVLIDDNKALHCTNITVEMMIKASPDAVPLYASGEWVHALSMVSDVANNKRAWGIMIRGAGEMFCYMENYKDPSKNMNGYNGNPYIYSTWVASGIPKITDGKWHHVAMTYDGATVRLYVDYTERGSCAYAGPIAYNDDCNGKLSIGPNYANSYGGWDGFIDEVRISDAALPPEKFLHVGGTGSSAMKVTDSDTALYLPFDSVEYSTDPFFGQEGSLLAFNSAAVPASNSNSLIRVNSVYLSNGGIRPIPDASSLAFDRFRNGVLADADAVNGGCWKFEENEDLSKIGWSVHLMVDDFTRNNNQHLITSGDFTIEFWLKSVKQQSATRNIIVEQSGTRNAATMRIYLDAAKLKYQLVSQQSLDAYEADGSAVSYTQGEYADINDSQWHHVALSVDRAAKTVAFYVDGRVVGQHSNFILGSKVSTNGSGKWFQISGGWGADRNDEFQNMSIDELRITRRALAPQEFLMAGAVPDLGATRTWIGFEGDLSAEPAEGMIPVGTSTATTIDAEFSPFVPGVRIVDGNGQTLRSSNRYSMSFSGAHGSGESSPDTASQRLFFGRNLLLEKDMKSMTVEFFMKGTKNAAKDWATILRMYGNATGSDSSPFRRLWSFGYSNSAGNVYVVKDVNGASQATFYPDNNVSFADGKWHHVAITFAPDGHGNTLCNVYRDYQRLGSQHTFTGELECGNYGTSSFAIGSRYNGHIDEVRISKGVLPVNKMMHLIKAGFMLLIR